MAHQPTCGQGLAEYSVLPAKLAELVSALADNLEVHAGTLVLSDEKARTEHAAYVKLAAEHRRIAADLHDPGAEMAGYRDLPMGAHDEEALASPPVVQAFSRFVGAQRALVALLRERVTRDQEMLEAMGGADGPT